MTTNVHDITDVKKSWKQKLPSKKTALKAVALTIFGGCVALVAVDKLGNHSQDDETLETTTD